MRALRNAAYVLNNYGQNSSLHGLYHLYQSTDIVRRVFWLIVLLAALGTGVFHTIMSVQRYLKIDIFVHVSDEATESKFPDITLCSIKPFSESLLVQYSSVVDRYFDKHWNYFDDWFVADRRQRANESGVAHRKRLKKIFARFLQIIWVSEDSRDLGIDGVSMLLDCSYEGKPCDSRNFTLVRDPDSWNCYNFSPNKDVPVGDKGLQLILFTDSNFYHPISTGSMISVEDERADGESVDDFMSTIQTWNSLKYFLTSRKRSLNQIAQPSMVQSDGLRLIVHEPGSHPMTSLHRLEFEAGAAGAVSINQMLATRLDRPPKFECVSPPYDKVRFATDFYSNGNLVLRSFDKLLDAHVVEAKQAMVQKACGCRSHRYPFAVAPASLCYYAPPAERRQPSAQLMERMDCHDRTVTLADRQTYQLVKENAKSASCRSMLHTFSTNVYGWPKDDDLDSIFNRYIMPKFLNDTSLLPGDGKKHSIFNFTDSEIVKLVGGKEALVSRQAAALKQLLSSNVSKDCSGYKKAKQPNDTQQNEDFWCLKSAKRLRRNLIRLSVRHARRKSRKATEHFSYKWPEALSELGGICGLWLGVSILTVFELLEVMYLMCTFQMEIPPSKEEGGNVERPDTAGNNDTSIALSDQV